MAENATSAVKGLAAICFDSVDPPALARFWQRLLGGDVELFEGGHAELQGPTVRLDFLKVPDPTPGKNRLHVDLDCSDYERAIQHALDAGATRADDVYVGDGWQVLRDPEGNEFCILRPR